MDKAYIKSCWTFNVPDFAIRNIGSLSSCADGGICLNIMQSALKHKLHPSYNDLICTWEKKRIPTKSLYNSFALYFGWELWQEVI